MHRSDIGQRIATPGVLHAQTLPGFLWARAAESEAQKKRGQSLRGIRTRRSKARAIMGVVGSGAAWCSRSLRVPRPVGACEVDVRPGTIVIIHADFGTEAMNWPDAPGLDRWN